MASRTLLQLFTLSIIFTNQSEARTFNKTHDLEKNQQYDIITTPVNERSVKANATDVKNTVLMKNIYHFDQRSDVSAESRNNILSRNTYDRLYKLKGTKETDSGKLQTEQHSDDNLKSNVKITSNRIELTSSDNRKHFSNEGTCSEETNQVNSIKRKLVPEVMAHTRAIKKVKQSGETKLEPNDESLQNYMEKDDHPTVKLVRRQKQLTVKPRYTKSRTTQATREKQIIPEITHKRYSEDENQICETKHCDYKNHRSFEKISREHDVYKLKRRDEFKTASKGNNKKKYNMKIKHRHNEIHRASKTQPKKNTQYKLKHRDFEKPILSNIISVENDIYVRKQIDDYATVDETGTDNYQRKHIDDSATVEESVSKQVKNPKYKPKFSNHFQIKRQRDKNVRKVRHTDKTKHNSKTKKHVTEKVKSKQEKYKPTLKKDRDSVLETHVANSCKSDNERNANSGDILNPDDADTSSIENQDEKETLESYEETLKQNDLLNNPKLPFYVSSTTKRAIIEIFKKQPQKPVTPKIEKKTDILLDDLNTVLKGNCSDLINENIDLNTTISRLAKSKILDFITDRVAVQMLKKLENSLATKNSLRTKEVNPEKVEQIDILFKNNGDMLMMGPEQEKEEDKFGFRETFYA